MVAQERALRVVNANAVTAVALEVHSSFAFGIGRNEKHREGGGNQNFHEFNLYVMWPFEIKST